MTGIDPVTQFTDKRLSCVGCRKSFVWTVEAQREAALFNWWPKDPPNAPRRCPDCQAIQRRRHGPGHR